MTNTKFESSTDKLPGIVPLDLHLNDSSAENRLERPRMCRICLEENEQDYVAPCMCSGTIGYVHTACIREYICRQLSHNDLKKPSDLRRIACEMCNRQIQFEYVIKPAVGCCCQRPPRKSTAWMLLLVLMIVFSMLLGALLIVVVYYHTDPNGHDIFKDNPGGIWIVVGIAPLVTIALLLTIYYFVNEMMHGRVIITRILNRGERMEKFKPPPMYDYDYYTIDD